FYKLPRPPKPTLFPYTTLFRSVSGSIQSGGEGDLNGLSARDDDQRRVAPHPANRLPRVADRPRGRAHRQRDDKRDGDKHDSKRRSEEHTSELQSRGHLVCRLLL